MAKKSSTSGGDGIHKALTHPVRTYILLAVEELSRLSPKRFMQQRHDAGESTLSLGVAAYHFRILEKYGAIAVVDEVPRRGATEHVYALNPASPVPDMLRMSHFLQSAKETGRAKAPMALGVREALTVIPLEVDQQGHEDLEEALLSMQSRIKEIGTECQRRLRSSPPGDAIPLRVGFGAVGPPIGLSEAGKDQGVTSSGK